MRANEDEAVAVMREPVADRAVNTIRKLPRPSCAGAGYAAGYRLQDGVTAPIVGPARNFHARLLVCVPVRPK